MVLARSLVVAFSILAAAFAADAQVNSWSDPLDSGSLELGETIVTVHPTDPAVVFVGEPFTSYGPGRLRKSIDGGATWATVFSYSDRPVTIIVDPASGSTRP